MPSGKILESKRKRRYFEKVCFVLVKMPSHDMYLSKYRNYCTSEAIYMLLLILILPISPYLLIQWVYKVLKYSSWHSFIQRYFISNGFLWLSYIEINKRLTVICILSRSYVWKILGKFEYDLWERKFDSWVTSVCFIFHIFLISTQTKNIRNPQGT